MRLLNSKGVCLLAKLWKCRFWNEFFTIYAVSPACVLVHLKTVLDIWWFLLAPHSSSFSSTSTIQWIFRPTLSCPGALVRFFALSVWDCAVLARLRLVQAIRYPSYTGRWLPIALIFAHYPGLFPPTEHPSWSLALLILCIVVFSYRIEASIFQLRFSAESQPTLLKDILIFQTRIIIGIFRLKY